jgi:hypothetical protein
MVIERLKNTLERQKNFCSTRNSLYWILKKIKKSPGTFLRQRVIQFFIPIYKKTMSGIISGPGIP